MKSPEYTEHPSFIYKRVLPQLRNELQELHQHLTGKVRANRGDVARIEKKFLQDFETIGQIMEMQGGGRESSGASFTVDLETLIIQFKESFTDWVDWSEKDKNRYVNTFSKGLAHALAALCRSDALITRALREKIEAWIEYIAGEVKFPRNTKQNDDSVFQLFSDLVAVSLRMTKHSWQEEDSYRVISLCAREELTTEQQAALIIRAFEDCSLSRFTNEKRAENFFELLSDYKHLVRLARNEDKPIPGIHKYLDRTELKPGVNDLAFPVIFAEMKSAILAIRNTLLSKFADTLGTDDQSEATVSDIVAVLDPQEVRAMLQRDRFNLPKYAGIIFNGFLEVCKDSKNILQLNSSELVELMQVFKDLIAIDPSISDHNPAFVVPLLPFVDATTKAALRAHNNAISDVTLRSMNNALEVVEHDQGKPSEFSTLLGLYRALSFELREDNFNHCLLIGVVLNRLKLRNVGAFAEAVLRLPLEDQNREVLITMAMQFLRTYYPDPDDAEDSYAEKYFGRLLEIIYYWYIDKEHPDLIAEAR